MLFPFQFLEDHSIYKLQDWVDQIFLEVWCNADPQVEYDVELLPDEIKEIVIDISNNNSISDYFYGPIENVYEIFQTYSQAQIEDLRTRYLQTKELEKICKNEDDIFPFSIGDIARDYSELKEPLKDFFLNLWKGGIKLSLIKKKIGSMDQHYKQFIVQNNKGICPFCGLHPLDEPDVKSREAYDHYLSKSKYPLLSINFKNLAPMCHKCNSVNKLEKDPIFASDGRRRKAFYIYIQDYPSVEIQMDLSNRDYMNLKSEEVEISFGPEVINEELNTWVDLFSIKERYQSTCCKNGEGKYWIKQIIEESINYGLTPEQFLRGKLQEATNNPYSEKNFLRKPFLEACERIGLFEV